VESKKILKLYYDIRYKCWQIFRQTQNALLMQRESRVDKQNYKTMKIHDTVKARKNIRARNHFTRATLCTTPIYLNDDIFTDRIPHQWLKWSCEAGGGSPDEARLEQTPYPFHIQLIWRYLGITFCRFNQGGSYYCTGAQIGAGGWAPLSPLHFNHCPSEFRRQTNNAVTLKLLF